MTVCRGETYAGPNRNVVLIPFLAHQAGGVGCVGAGDVPTDEHQVIGAVGFFEDDYDRI